MAAGLIMSMGTYNFSTARMIFDAESEECVECQTSSYTDGVRNKGNWDFKAKFRFPNGGTADVKSTLIGRTNWTPSHVTVTTKAAVVPDDSLPASQKKLRTREVTLYGLVHAIAWSRIDVKDVVEIRDKDGGGKVVRRWIKKTSHKAYSFQKDGRGRETHQWVTHEDSIAASMKMIDIAHEKTVFLDEY
ncbi:hypothetical protein M406DRAFT_327841 [Cryphonectria parasitica EP155]|uniref:Uncharacterized protein n=1 Tax=Cryphonectria parasitica (strain ATCC 38755 / EP155) TaxID=660469 RepID=A0A9P5CR41_CRYP1|nr:uncharacterized protein M406DRAFT_327841 [Cryphonectria parasitica EP155]KAF3766715.1 hypothetical protein M406DRAFT_327841 [Cryphonectria parasitica EP155]